MAKAEADFLADKIAGLRIFPDPKPAGEGEAASKDMNRSLSDVGAPSWWSASSRSTAMPAAVVARRSPARWPPPRPSRCTNTSSTKLRSLGPRVATGRFGAMMAVSLVNDGPVTLGWIPPRCASAATAQGCLMTASVLRVSALQGQLAGPAAVAGWPGSSNPSASLAA